MARIPKKPEEIFPEITGDSRKIFGEELISIILYGSGAGEDYIPGKSDLNFLITLTDRGIEGGIVFVEPRIWPETTDTAPNSPIARAVQRMTP